MSPSGVPYTFAQQKVLRVGIAYMLLKGTLYLELSLGVKISDKRGSNSLINSVHFQIRILT